jgi:hypothetical protein
MEMLVEHGGGVVVVACVEGDNVGVPARENLVFSQTPEIGNSLLPFFPCVEERSFKSGRSV